MGKKRYNAARSDEEWAVTADRTRRERWRFPAKARVIHPVRGEMIVPAASPFAAILCAAEAWGCPFFEIRDARVWRIENEEANAMSRTEQAMIKINEEMQKDPDNAYLEILGHYIIDRCGDEQVAQAVLADKKTLKGCVDSIQAAALKKVREKKGVQTVVFTERDFYHEADQYFAIGRDDGARAEHSRPIAERSEAGAQIKSNVISLDFGSFL